ncbi:unnamed protein product [Menidia menidia]|uniref:(Atlantic silverside) hypothetical protein n=1 Tax=Menidia menidia TaxID=238744 RepID=A0A8S4BZ08_9TELE|nr:unnamed protein product [Menidia menidia]
MALPPAAAVWSRTGARPKVSGPNSPANRPSHLMYGTDVVRGEHPASPVAASDATAPSVLIRQRGRSSSSFRRRLLVEAVNRRSGGLPRPQPPGLDYSPVSGAPAAAAEVPSSADIAVPAVFISGPLPTCGRCADRFSRILHLHTWLQFACAMHNIGFIHNFDLFWERPSFYGPDGLHPNRLKLEASMRLPKVVVSHAGPVETKGKIPWTQQEKMAVQQFMTSFVAMRKVPGKNECIMCIEKSSPALQRRTWKDKTL